MERHRDKNLSKIIQSSSTNTNLRVITRDKNYRIIIFLSLSLFFLCLCKHLFYRVSPPPYPVMNSRLTQEILRLNPQTSNINVFKCPRNLYFSAKTSKFRCLIIF